MWVGGGYLALWPEPDLDWALSRARTLVCDEADPDVEVFAGHHLSLLAFPGSDLVGVTIQQPEVLRDYHGPGGLWNTDTWDFDDGFAIELSKRLTSPVCATWYHEIESSSQEPQQGARVYVAGELVGFLSGPGLLAVLAEAYGVAESELSYFWTMASVGVELVETGFSAEARAAFVAARVGPRRTAPKLELLRRGDADEPHELPSLESPAGDVSQAPRAPREPVEFQPFPCGRVVVVALLFSAAMVIFIVLAGR